MKYILNFIWGILLFASCSPDDLEILDHSVKVEDIVKIELRGDHKTLIPSEGLKMDFRVLAYSTKEFTEYSTDEIGDTIFYNNETVKDTFLIPADLIPAGFLKVYDEQGKELKDNSFSTTDREIKTYHFQAKAGNLVSNVWDVTTREVPEESYEEVVYPVIFHVILPPASGGPSYEVSSETLEEKLERLNNIFNRRVTTNPNGGNVKVTFRLAEYDTKGQKLVEKGKNKVQLSSNLDWQGYEDYINSKLIWDPTKYLNIYLCRFSMSWSDRGDYAYVAQAPKVIMAGNSIPGIDATEVIDFKPSDVTSFREVGLMINLDEFLSPTGHNSNYLEPATPVALYFGLKKTKLTVNPTPGYDNDYCPDTYYYYYDAGNIYKSTYWDEEQEEPIEYFTSFNIMEDYSRKNSITADQAARMRAVVDKCPSRWSYKSKWAFTGKNE